MYLNLRVFGAMHHLSRHLHLMPVDALAGSSLTGSDLYEETVLRCLRVQLT
jgi:hypothetical protein